MKIVSAAKPALQVVAINTPAEQLVRLWVHGKSKNTQKLYHWVSSLLFGEIDKPVDYLTSGGDNEAKEVAPSAF